MPIKINGTNTAANPSITGDDTDTGIVYGSDQIDLSTGGSSKVTLNGSNLGVGTTSPASPLHSHLASSDANRIRVTNSTTGATASDGFIVGLTSSEEGIIWNYENSDMLFGTNNAERIRILTDGSLLIGTTSKINNEKVGLVFDNNTVVGYAAKCSATGSATFFDFRNSSGTQIGNILTSNSTSTAYNTSSDYRLKENAVAISDGITRLKTLKPYRFNFKADATTTVDGFFAHEVSSIVPEAITGTKDEVVTQAMIDSGKYKEGTLNDPIHQGIDQSKLVPLLVAAVQELITKVAALEGA